MESVKDFYVGRDYSMGFLGVGIQWVTVWHKGC